MQHDNGPHTVQDLARAWSLLGSIGNLDKVNFNFLCVDFPNFVGRLHSRRVEQAQAEQHNDVLKEVISFLTKWLKKADVEIYDSVPIRKALSKYGLTEYRPHLQVLKLLLQMFDTSKSQFYTDSSDLSSYETSKRTDS